MLPESGRAVFQRAKRNLIDILYKGVREAFCNIRLETMKCRFMYNIDCIKNSIS